MTVVLCLSVVRDQGGSDARFIAAHSFGNTVLRAQVLYIESMDGVDLVPVTTGSSLDPESQLVFNWRRVGWVCRTRSVTLLDDLFVSLSFNSLPMIVNDKVSPSPLGARTWHRNSISGLEPYI